jgi:hypothetical protein
MGEFIMWVVFIAIFLIVFFAVYPYIMAGGAAVQPVLQDAVQNYNHNYVQPILDSLK